MNRAWPAILLSALVSLAAGPSQPDLALSSESSIEGTWTMVVFNENPYPAGYFWVIDQHKVRIIVNGKQSLEWTYSVNSSRSPREADFPGTLAIWKVEGDRLLICLGSGTTRPKDFTRKGGSLYDFRRAKQ